MESAKFKVFDNEEQMKQFIFENKHKIKRYQMHREVKNSNDYSQKFYLVYFENDERNNLIIKDLLADKTSLKNEIDETLDHIVGELHLLKDYFSMSVEFFNKKAASVIEELENILDVLKK